MAATFPYVGFLDGQAYPVIPAGTTTVNVATSSALTTALANATAGTRIVLANATYSGAFTLASKAGTSTAGISIEAATTGGAVFASGSTFSITGASAYITLKGLSFPYELSSGNLVQFRGTSNRCRVTRCLFGPTSIGTAGANKTPFVYMGDDTEHIRIDHNEFRNKANPGNTILGDGNFTSFQAVRHIRIDHNYIHDIRPEVDNEKEPIRLGVSTMSKTNSFSVIERNRFENCICEPEIVSAKAGGIRITGNTFIKSIGGPVYRHGVNGVMNDNYVVDKAQTFGTTIGSGGFRFYDSGHEVSYNYVEGIYWGASSGNFQGPLLLDSGDAEGSSTNYAAHWRVINALVEKNVLVGNPEGIRIGHNYSSAPSGVTVRDNVVAQATTGTAVTQRIAPVSSTITNNSYASTPAAAGLAQDSLAIWRKAGVGPRLTFLQSGDVGPNGDPTDTDGTGTLVSGGGTTPTPTPVDDGTAATKLGWGAPLALSDEFEYSGAPDSTKWSVYNGPGHDGNGTRSPAQVTVAGGKMVLSGASGSAASAGLAHKMRQQYGRWEVRMRTAQTASGGSSSQTLGVGGVATPTGAIVETGDRGAFTISTSGTASNPRVYDGKGFSAGRITVAAGTSYVVIQNYRINADGQYGIYINPPGSGSKSHHITVQNNDFRNIHGPGDLNCISFFADDIKILFNTAVDFVVGDPGGSHTDAIQSWNNDPNESSSRIWIIGNRFVGPKRSTNRQIHQCIMAQGKAATDGGGGGTGDSTDWYISDNEFGADWNQDVKLEDIDNSVLTRNRFTGSSSRAVEIRSTSTNTRFYSDNTVASTYGQVGATITGGAGPVSPLGNTTTGGTNSYHPVLIVWPDSDRWPEDGEYDFVELSQPGQQSLTAFMHYPHDPGSTQQIQFTKAGVDTSVFHNYAFEWTPTGLVGYVDGAEWFRAVGGATSTRRDIQTMPSGHLTVQLDAFAATSMIPATMELEWSRVYSLTPSGPTTGPQTITTTGIATAERIGIATVTGASPAPQPGSTATLLGSAVLGAAQLGFTNPGGGTNPIPGGQSVTGAGGITYTRAFGVPALSVEDGPQTVAPGSVTSAEAFGRPRLVGGAPPAPAPGGVLVPTLFAVSADGQTLTPLPFWTKIAISPVRNSPGALGVEYPAGAPGFTTLHDGVSASPLKALEIRLWLGGNATGALGGWLVQKAGDDLEPGSPWTFSGHFHEWILSKALVFPQAISDANKNGSLRFAGANAGLILGTVLNQAQARGALPLVTRDFTNTHDSNGKPWAKSVSSLAFAPKTTVAQVADKCVELGMCEYEVTAGRVWRAYNPGSRGTDRTTGASPLTFAHAVNLSEHARRESAKDAGTAVLAAGAEGFYASVSSLTAQAELGWRAEVAADAGQIASADGVQAAAATYLEIARAGIAEYAASVEFTPGAPLPLLDYGVGDWAYTWAGNRRRRLRIAQLVLEFSNDQPPSGRVALNDLITDKLTALYQRLNAISTGDAVVGTSNPTPGGTGEDTIPPAAPTGVTVSSTIAYQIPGEAVVRALVDVGWQPVTTNAYPDAIAADKARAAGLIADRMRSGQGIFEDWTWAGAPGVVGLYNDVLLQEWASAPSNPGDSREPTDPLLLAAMLDWLEAYAGTAQGGGTITDDVAQYRVQYRYLGAQPIGQGSGDGGLPPDWEPTTPRDPNEQTASAGWFEPTESPTTSTRLTFGEVIGGRSIGVRVAAVDRTGNQGPWSVVVAATSAVDDQPPPKPSKPIAVAWFETANVTWDGKGAAGEDLFAAASDLASGGRVEVHMGQGIDFTPHRPTAGDGKSVDLGTSTTYQTDFQWAGTTNITAIPRGVTVYFRFVAVDRNGNASDPSDTSDGVLSQKLVNIQFGPDAIDRLQIRNGAIGSAEIDLLAVNDAHISNISVGKLTAGTMNANVVIGGRFETPISNGNQVQLDAAGLRMYRNNTVVGRWQVFDGSMLMTGQYQSNLTGPRVVINPGGSNPDTIRFYPSLSETFSSIDSVDFNGGNTAGIRIVGSGTGAVANRGMVLVRDQYASLVHGRTDLTYWGSEIWVEQNFTRNKSATVDLVVDERLTPIGGERRVAMIHYDSSGRPINATGLYYKKTPFNGGEPFLFGNGQDVGIVFGGGRLVISNNPNNQRRGIIAGSFTVESSREVKYGFRDLDGDPLELLRGVKPQHFKLKAEPDDQSEKLGFIAEDMPEAVRESVHIPGTDDQPDRTIVGLDYQAITALEWAILRRLDDRLTAVENARPQ